jgi:hypothetical protein
MEREDLRVLIRDQADRDAIASRLVPYRTGTAYRFVDSPP